MSADAIAVFRPKNFERLKPFLDLDDENEDSEGLYAELLDDGGVLVHTFQPFQLFRENPRAVAEWLAQFGDALAEVHHDPRGIFLFPDSAEPTATTYDGVIEEIARAGEGVFLPTDLESLDQLAALATEAEAAGIDMNALQGLATQLLGGAASGASFEVGKLLTDLNEKLIGAIGAAAEARDTDVDGRPPVREEELDGDVANEAPAVAPAPAKK